MCRKEARKSEKPDQNIDMDKVIVQEPLAQEERGVWPRPVAEIVKRVVSQGTLKENHVAISAPGERGE